MEKLGFSGHSMNFVMAMVIGMCVGLFLGTLLTDFRPRKIYVSTNPRGAETLAPDITESKSDFYLRRLWGEPIEDVIVEQKYLVVFTVGAQQKSNIDAAVKKFSQKFSIMLFHYDGNTTGWDEFEWSKRAIHVSVRKQTKWWYAKRFLHPDIVAAYDYIFIWDEDLGLEHFDAEEYIKVVRKHGLEISQPGMVPKKGRATWELTKRKPGVEIHRRVVIGKWGRCLFSRSPPCAAFVEIMAPVFSRKAWRCAWHLIQNDLVHGWGLDFSLRRCAEPAHVKMGVVDSQWIVHQGIPSLKDQDVPENGILAGFGVRERCEKEMEIFNERAKAAEDKYFEENGIFISP